MKLTFKTDVDRNGNSKSLTFDTETKRYYREYNPYSWDCKVKNRKELDNLERELKNNGYVSTIRL